MLSCNLAIHCSSKCINLAVSQLQSKIFFFFLSFCLFYKSMDFCPRIYLVYHWNLHCTYPHLTYLFSSSCKHSNDWFGCHLNSSRLRFIFQQSLKWKLISLTIVKHSLQWLWNTNYGNLSEIHWEWKIFTNVSSLCGTGLRFRNFSVSMNLANIKIKGLQLDDDNDDDDDNIKDSGNYKLLVFCCLVIFKVPCKSFWYFVSYLLDRRMVQQKLQIYLCQLYRSIP